MNDMKSRPAAVALGAILLAATQSASAADSLCRPLLKFVSSVTSNETRTLKFHTSWGSNFRDEAEPAFFAKRCDHGGYEPAKPVCEYLMKHGATEFSGNNARAVVSCLSPQTRIDSGLLIHALSVSFSVGSESRGSQVDVEYKPDDELGGMVLSVTADGYGG